jgi:superfamily II DNA or RNA helicase
LVTIATIQALSAAKRKFPDLSGFDVLLVDECHRIPAASAFVTAMRCPAKIRIGLTATPDREDNRQMRVIACTGTVTASRTAEELIDSGNLAKPRFEIYRIPDWESCGYKKNMKWNDAVEYGIIGNAYRNDKITQIASKYHNAGKTVLICVDRIAHGEILQNLLDEDAIPCCLLTSGAKNKDRALAISEFGTHGDFVMISTLLKEGVDIPSMDVIILAAGGKSAIAVIQKIGRVLRVTSDKDAAVVVDFADRGLHLARHFEDRCATYSKTYGKWFKPEYLG